MNYIYPLIQTVIDDSVFLMEENISNDFTGYAIMYRHNGSVLKGYISSDTLQTLMQNGTIKTYKKQNFANGKTFIKIKLQYLHDSASMGDTAKVSKTLF